MAIQDDEERAEAMEQSVARDQDALQDGTSATRDTPDKDVDETRRLLYMTLFARRTKRFNLVGTLVNAMRHHQGNDAPDLEERLLAQVEDDDADESWVRDQIRQLTERAGGS